MLAYIDSVEQLEILALMRANRDRDWTAAALSVELRSDVGAIEARVELLARHKLLARSAGSYRYELAGAADARVEEVSEAYRQRPVSVIDAIYSKPQERLRTFADAFLLRPKDDDR